MKSFLKRIYIFNFDLLPKYNNSQKRIQRLIIINYFLVFSLLIFVIHDLILALLKIQPYTFEKFPILIFWFISLIALWLTGNKKYLLSKLIIIFGPLVFVSSYSLTGYILGEHFLWQPIMLLGISIIPYLVLDLKKEKFWVVISFLSFLIYIIFHDSIMMSGSVGHYGDVFTKLNTTPFIYDAVRIVIYLFLSFIIYYSVRLNEHQQIINERINKSLLNTSNHLENVNAELQAQRNALNNSASLLITDESRKIISANDNFLSISGYSFKELAGKDPSWLISNYHDKYFFKAMRQTLNSGGVWRGELKNKRKNGKCFWMQTAISPIYKHNKQLEGYMIVMFDITKLKNDEERLEKINFEKDRILYAVAHDLKNPLLNFQALLNLIKSGSVKKEEEKEIYRLMSKDCIHSTDLIAELLEIGRLEDESFVLEKKSVDLNAFLLKCLEQFEQKAAKKDIKFTKLLDKDLQFIKINEKEFIRVIYNLISNAIKFTPNHGEIKIETKTTDKNKVSIKISDTGIGISKEVLPILFDKFSKARRKGIQGEKSTGLGMWIVKHIINLHNGEISVISKENEGTIFNIKLPI